MAPDEVPSALETVTVTAPEACAGETTVSWVDESTVMLVPAVPPKLTVELETKLVPVTVTLVPPALDPNVGEILVTVGAP